MKPPWAIDVKNKVERREHLEGGMVYTVSEGSSRSPRSALSINLTVAELFIRTINRLPAENDMPEELHDPTTLGVVLVRVDHPLADLDVVVDRPLADLIARDGELRAAGGADLLGHAEEALWRVDG